MYPESLIKTLHFQYLFWEPYINVTALNGLPVAVEQVETGYTMSQQGANGLLDWLWKLSWKSRNHSVFSYVGNLKYQCFYSS